MKKTKSKGFWIGAIIVILVIISCIILALYGGNEKYEEIMVMDSLITSQSKKEEDFEVTGYTIEQPNVILNPYGNSPLTALVLFETEELVNPKVTIVGKDENTTFTHTFNSNKEHYLSIYGLYADYNNEVIIEYEINGETISKTINIETDKLPDNFVLPTRVIADKENLDNQLYFFTPSSSGYTCAYDVNGDVRWYLTNYALWEINRLENGHLLVSTERLINPPYYMTGLYEIDLLGKIYVEYSLEGGYHHDYFEMENGNLLIASDDFNNDSGTVEDYIVEIDRTTGAIVKTFDLKNILNMTDGKSENWIDYDWFHNNSVWYDKDTNSITLSGRHQDAVINIDYDTGELNWIIGDPTNWSEEYQKYFFTPIGTDFEWQWSQHAAMITPEGYVFILDNGNNKSKIKEEYVPASESYTRGVMYKIDTDNMTIEQVWQYGKERGSDYYSPYISDVDYLDANHYIVHSGGIAYKDGEVLNQPAGLAGADELKSITTELLNDEIIFELELPTNNYRVEKMDLYASSEQLELGQAKRLGTLGETEGKDSIALILNAKTIDDEYNKHNITITKEEDRLVINGTFERGTSVEVVLYKFLSSRTYEWRISQRPYTALCVDIFNEEENELGINTNKYINAEGLKGKYNIYIKIDDVLYNTQKYVEF